LHLEGTLLALAAPRRSEPEHKTLLTCVIRHNLRESYWDLRAFPGTAKAYQSQRSWRTRPSKTAYRLVIHPEQSANLGETFPCITSPLRLLLLMRRQLVLPAEPHSPCHGSSSSLSGPSQDQRTFKLC
jgi:hypothetical protein